MLFEEKMNQNIYDYIHQLGDQFISFGKAPDEKINAIEKTLGVTLPESYKQFLREFGYVLMPAFGIYGTGKAETPACVSYTLSMRKFGLPLSNVVIGNEGDEVIYCLDTQNLKDGECPVVVWEYKAKPNMYYCKDFSEFFEMRLSEAITFL